MLSVSGFYPPSNIVGSVCLDRLRPSSFAGVCSSCRITATTPSTVVALLAVAADALVVVSHGLFNASRVLASSQVLEVSVLSQDELGDIPCGYRLDIRGSTALVPKSTVIKVKHA